VNRERRASGYIRRVRAEKIEAIRQVGGGVLLTHARHLLLSGAKTRAKKAGLPFNLTEEDIELPLRCPALGIDLIYGGGHDNRDASPSLDRLRPEFGYVRGNVATISYRANRIKSNAQLHELKSIAAFLEDRLSSGWMVPPMGINE
jgi:hypothetical protein